MGQLSRTIQVVLAGGFLSFGAISVLARNGVIKGSLFDLVFLISFPFLFLRVMRRPNVGWAGLGLLIATAWILDMWLYLRVLPLKNGIWVPFITWASGFKSADDMDFGWLLRTVVGLGLFCAFASAVKAKKELMSLTLGLTALWMIGFAPVMTQRMTLSRSVRELAIHTAEGRPIGDREDDVRHAIAGRTYQDVDVLAEKDNNRGAPLVRIRKGQVLVVGFNSEPATFYFTNKRNEPGVKQEVIRGTFQVPALCNDSYFSKGAARAVPCRGYPTSTTAVRVGGGSYMPLIRDLHVFVAEHSGEVNFTYNFPRGIYSFMNEGSLGKRVFRVWVLDSSDLVEDRMK